MPASDRKRVLTAARSAGLIGTLLLGAAAAPPPGAAPPADAPSFFDGFDRLDTQRWYVSDGWANGEHQGCTWSAQNVMATGGKLTVVLGRASDTLRPFRCGELHTRAIYGYGTYEARIRTASGSGLNTAMFTYSGPPAVPAHDEIDFEFLGKSPRQVQLNYYTNHVGGHETFPDLGSDVSTGFNDYAFVWEPSRIRWYMNGRLIREQRGPGLPTHPGNFFLSLWNGSKIVDGWLGSFNGTRTPVSADIDWAAYTRPGERCLFPQSVTCKLS